jgi:methionyl-tRNA formyltransferase
MLLAEPMDIADSDTTGSLHDRLASLGGRLIVEALELAACGGLHATAQPTDGVTYAKKVDKAEAAVDWHLDADTITRRIRAFNPAPGAVARLRGEVVKLWHAQALQAAQPAVKPGTVTDASAAGLCVACGTGAVMLTELQRPGGKRLNSAQFLQGQSVQVGEQFDLGTA